MIVYNTTFHIHKEILGECLDYLKTSYIPKAMNSGFLHNPYLRRILSSENEEGESYSIQFHAKNIDTLNYWLQNEGAVLQQGLVKRFKERIVGFTTLLEEIDLE